MLKFTSDVLGAIKRILICFMIINMEMSVAIEMETRYFCEVHHSIYSSV